MRIYIIQCVDYGWKVKIQSKKNYAIGDLCICRGCVCVVREICEEVKL